LKFVTLKIESLERLRPFGVRVVVIRRTPGVVDVALLSVTRRWHLREGVSFREIARRTKLSRNIISKYLTIGRLEPVCPRRKSPSKLDEYAEVLSSWFKRGSTRGRKQRGNLKQLYADPVKRGHTDSYDRGSAIARLWRRRQQEASKVSRGTFVPLTSAPGEAFQFDCSENLALIGRERTKLMVAQFKLCNGRAFMLRACRLQTHVMLFDSYNHCLTALRGCRRGHFIDEQGTFHSGDLRTRSIGLDTPQAPHGSADVWSRACIDPCANPTAQSVAEHDPRVVAQLNMAHCIRAYAMLTRRSVPTTNGAKVDQQQSIRSVSYLSLIRSHRIGYSFLQTPSRTRYHLFAQHAYCRST